jgi:hypothetical protein
MDSDKLPLFRMQKDSPLLQRRRKNLGKFLGVFHDVKPTLRVFVCESMDKVRRVHCQNRLLRFLDLRKT